MRKILITGGCGFVGSHLTEYIFNNYKKSKIIIYDKITYAGSIKNIKHILLNKRVKLVKSDENRVLEVKCILHRVFLRSWSGQTLDFEERITLFKGFWLEISILPARGPLI